MAKTRTFSSSSENRIPVGSHTTISDLSSVVTLAPNAAATHVWLQAFTKDVRVTFDGTNPTASTGFLIVADEPPVELPAWTGVTLKLIQVEASATAQWQAVK